MSLADGLPRAWARTTVGEVAGAIQYGLTASAVPKDSGPRFLRITDIHAGRVDWRSVPSCELTTEDAEKYSLAPGDIVFARTGATTGKSYLIRDCPPSVFASYLIRLKAERDVDPAFIQYFFQSADYWRQISAGKRGVGQPNVNAKILAALELPLAPLPEQRRIVAKIEELFSDLDVGVAALERAQAKLERYRASVLKAAVEGKLTEGWRRENPPEETGEELLQRVLVERRRRWEEEQIAKYEAKGKKPPKNWQERYKEPVGPDPSALPELPKGWCWGTLGQLAWSVKDGPHYSPEYSENGIPFISGGNVRPSGVDFSSAKFISPELHEELSRRCVPELGDILYTKGGTTGIARVNTYDIAFNVWVHVAVLKIHDGIEPFYMQHALNSPWCYAQSQRHTRGVGNQDLGLTRMIWITIPIPPPAEQREVVRLVDEAKAGCEEVASLLKKAGARSVAQRRSILRHAFEGKLVPQDPTDEPASLLLERIRAAREAEKPKKTRTRRKKTDQASLNL